MSLDPASSASHFWQIGELLDYLFERCSVADLASCARVSKHFQSHASDQLYKDVSTLQNVLQFLGPVGHETFSQNDGKLNFAFHLMPYMWRRFIPYGQRVRSLEYDESKLPSDGQLDEFCFNEIAATCPTGKVFPFLQDVKLVWRGPAIRGRFSPIFMGESLRRLSVDCDTQTLHYFLGSIPRVAPNLEVFRLVCSFHNSTIISLGDDIEGGLVALINGLPTLREVTLPSELLSQEVSLTLAAHPRIESTSQWWSKPLLWPQSFVAGSERLRTFRADIELDEMTRWLQPKSTESTLNTLHLSIRDIEPGDDINHCFGLLSKGFPDLTTLILDLNTHNTPSNHPEVTDDGLKALCSLRSLELFRLETPVPLPVLEKDIEQMAKAWPELRSFALISPSICTNTRSNVTLGILVTLTQSWPKLRALSLVFNTTLSPSRHPSGEEGFAYPDFEIDVGCSPIADAAAIAIFLSQLLPEYTRLLHCDQTLPKRTTSTARQAKFKSRHQRWKEVTTLLKPLLGARAREKDAETKVKSMTAELHLAQQENAELNRKLKNFSRSIESKSAPIMDYDQS
ncbi:hypothetical protein SISSUDRAFT_1126861 [Sistotremastrum suecicum HHB10207 ss-3]|uniref:F-box domain-containing protein n=1 Tax=Sistotremastrum suecicum HHB10207 ss-3 TaxID=1314776 RepID=A0A166FTC7_9AGAM|nr:hypothetical protein SISSUDRAFT_1126861 [Sistotremastrum suecicum HHB10207 ss-3]